jgi:hypothetical protein
MMLGILGICLSKGLAQTKIDTVSNFKVQLPIQKRFYIGNGLDFAMLSTSITSRPGKSTYLTIPRFTAIVNFGFSFHYDLNEHFGFLSGIGLRNMGFIDKYGDSTVKRRVYSLGIPLGVKLGDLRNRNFVIAGGGLDIPFNYREKGFVRRGDKTKFNEWFSERTPHVMPFIFAGYSFNPGFILKLQYYPGNFLNQDFTDNMGGKPYTDYDVHLLLLSVGIDIHYSQFRIQEREYQELKKEREQRKML